MLNVTPVSAGTRGVDYFLRQTGCVNHPERTQERTDEERAHPGVEYLAGAVAHGEPDGRWLGTGLEGLGLQDGGVVDPEMARQVFGRLEHPVTGERLGRAPMRFQSPTDRLAKALEAEPGAPPERQEQLRLAINDTQRKAVGYYDLTFSPAKSVSVYYAALMVAGRVDDAEKVWEAHREGVSKALAYMERESGYSRAGYHGRTKDGRSVGDYVEARSWIMARFDHTTNREQEPQLHSHAMLLNRVRCEGDGRWRAVDGKALFAEKRGADSIYEATMQAAIVRDLPVRFEAREDGKAQEIAGITKDVRDSHSTRTTQLQAQARVWAGDYEARHGYAPSRLEWERMTSDASHATRAAKGSPIGLGEQVGRWQAHHDLLAPLAAAEAAGLEGRERGFDRGAVIRAAVHQVQLSRASWGRSDLMLEIKRGLDGQAIAAGVSPEAVITGLADEALAPGAGYGVILLTAPDVVNPPAEVRRESDDRSRFRPHRDERYATEGQLSAEERLVATARAGGAPVLTAEQLVVAEAELVARGLGDDQRAAVLGVLGSGRRGDVLLGPAGAGKSYTTGAIKHLWERHHGPVMGLATAQNAANVLREEGLGALNVAAFLAAYEPDQQSGLAQQCLPADALLVIDETGMSATEQLDRVRAVADAANAKMLWTGDHEQLDSVGAGGALRLLAQEVPVLELTEVRRFEQEWEREASLRLRAGDRGALAEYEHRGRLVEGTVEAMREAAYEGYLADTLSGKSSVLLTGRNDEAAELSGRVRAKLAELGRVELAGSVLRDGNLAGVGDLVQTRRNAWDLTSDTGRAVANRDTWKVLERTPEGLRVELDSDPSVTLTLPTGYVAEDLTLAYASTSHAAQGRTVDTGHAVVDVGMSRGELYPNLTRGREWNGAYVVTHREAEDEHGGEAVSSDRFSVLAEVLDRDTAQHAALQVLQEEIEDSSSLASMGTIWATVVGEQARDRYSDTLLDVLGPEQLDRLTEEHGAGRLWRSIRDAELAGRDPDAALRAAVARGDLTDAESLSDVLRWRLNTDLGDRGTPAGSWQDRTPVVDTEIGRYTRDLADAMDRRTEQLGERTAADPPEWATKNLGEVPEEPVERATWVARAGAVAGWRELANVQGPTPLGAAPSREMPEQRAAWHAAYTALGAEEAGRDYAAASNDELRAMVAQHDREREWAPAHVADQLGEASRRATAQGRRAVLSRAEAAAAVTDKEREVAEQRGAIADAAGRSEAARAERLTKIHAARELWSEHTAEHAHAADMSQRELARREGADPERARPEEHNVRDARTTQEDLERAVARAHEATERILAERETDRVAAERAESARFTSEPVRVGPERDDGMALER